MRAELVLLASSLMAALANPNQNDVGNEARQRLGPEQQRGMIRQGTCGWSDESLVKCGRFYPPSLPATRKLEFYSRSGLFSCVEVDTSTYAIPSPHTVKGWCDQVPDGFLFHIKAFSLFCGQSVPWNSLPRAVRELPSMQALASRNSEVGANASKRIGAKDLSGEALDAIWLRFNAACLEAHQSEKMGMVVFQFQLGFKPSEENRQRVLECRQRLSVSLSMAVEFRAREWLCEAQLPSTHRMCEHNDLVLVLCDDLKHELLQPDKRQVGLPTGEKAEVLPIPLVVTAPRLGVYIRLHRRQGVHRVLSPDEFSAWRERLVLLQQLLRSRSNSPAQEEGAVFFMWGTDHEDAGIVNAQELRKRDPAMFFDWKSHTKALSQKAGTLLSYFSSPTPALGIQRPPTVTAATESCTPLISPHELASAAPGGHLASCARADAHDDTCPVDSDTLQGGPERQRPAGDAGSERGHEHSAHGVVREDGEAAGKRRREKEEEEGGEGRGGMTRRREEGEARGSDALASAVSLARTGDRKVARCSSPNRGDATTGATLGGATPSATGATPCQKRSLSEMRAEEIAREQAEAGQGGLRGARGAGRGGRGSIRDFFKRSPCSHK